MISLCVYSLLPLLLFLFGIRLLAEQHKDLEVFTTDAMLLTASSWLFYFLFRKHVSTLFNSKKIDATSRSSVWELFYKIGVFLARLHVVNIGWAVSHEKVILTRDFLSDYFTRVKNGFVLQQIQVFSCYE